MENNFQFCFEPSNNKHLVNETETRIHLATVPGGTLTAGNETEYIRILSDCMNKGILDNECTVLNASRFLEYVTGKRYEVTKEQFNDLKKVKCYPVRYVYNGRGHWVVVENGKIVFNSLINSQCVTKGKPDTKDNTRVIKLAR